MSPLLIYAMVFVSVAAVIGLLAFVFRDNNPQTAPRASTCWSASERAKANRRKTSSANSVRGRQKELFGGDHAQIPHAAEDVRAGRLPHQAEYAVRHRPVAGAARRDAQRADRRCRSASRRSTALLLFSLPWVWLWNKRRARLSKFACQLSDALELVARALRAGHSLAPACTSSPRRCPRPIADEFGRVFEEQNLGIPIEDAMKSMCDRVPNLDLRFFVTSVGIQRQTGGDLAEILDKIGYVVRERFRILGQVKALTGEGRLSGVVLIALPFALFGFMLNAKPDYIEPLWTTDLGKKMSIAAIIAQILGALVIRKIVNIKV